jgi:murein tripeptide amidase MpaA
MRIESDFECGNAVVESITDTEANLTVRPDTYAKSFQWFYFRVTGEAGIMRTFNLTNAHAVSYPQAWNGYRALASYDGNDWFRVQTQYVDGTLTFRHRAEQTSTEYAFFVPYVEAQREKLLDDCAKIGERRTVLTSGKGRPIDAIVFGDKAAAKKVWIYSRHHAGEPMAEYCIEGIMRRLADVEDPTVQNLLAAGIAFYCVPNINPDGTASGNLRANAAGIDLNRDWKQTVEPQSVEVAGLMKALEAEGVDFFIDLHGDEEHQYVWPVAPHPDLITAENAPRQALLESYLRDRYAEYGPTPKSEHPSPADSGMAVDWVAWKYKCPSLIIELPFKDTISANGRVDSLQVSGCMAFGHDCVDMIAQAMLG